MEPITNKSKFVKLYLDGVLGNRFRIWTNYKDAIKDKIQSVGFREIGKSGGGKFEMVSLDQIESTAIRWTSEGRQFYLNEGDYKTQSRATIQGEICITERGWELFVGPANVYKMRDMFANNLANQYYGINARQLMYRYIDANSIYDIEQILDLYPNHVIEFTSYNLNLGVLPGRNTIIWEVRYY